VGISDVGWVAPSTAWDHRLEASSGAAVTGRNLERRCWLGDAASRWLRADVLNTTAGIGRARVRGDGIDAQKREHGLEIARHWRCGGAGMVTEILERRRRDDDDVDVGE
jgi:hypothetical protein